MIPIDDDGETVVLAARRDGVEFARRTVFINDDDIGSTRVDLSVNPAQVREDAGATTVRVTASLNADARARDTEVAVTVGAGGDSARRGDGLRGGGRPDDNDRRGRNERRDDVPPGADEQRCRRRRKDHHG